MMDDLTNQGVTASQPSLKKDDGRPERHSLDRLLRSASKAEDDDSALVSAPFGFDTRVVALWRAHPANGSNGLARFVSRVAVLATLVIVASSAAAFYEIKQGRDTLDEPLTNEYAIADSAIQDEVLP